MGRKRAKRKKGLKEEEEDRLSSLQDDLLCRILALLPTKDVVATSTLSTRWKNLYASVTHLYFEDSPSVFTAKSTANNNMEFITFVTNIISAVLTKSKYIRKLQVNCRQGPRDTETTSIVASWIAAVSGPNLEDLNIFTQSLIGRVPLPPQLFNCRALTSMVLRGPFSLCVPEHILFPSLKNLSISKMVLPDNTSVRRFFSGCVVLERLGLCRCKMELISVFEVSINSLKHLSLDDISGDFELLLNTPNLEGFDIEGYATRGYSGHSLDSLLRANLKIDAEFGDDAYEEAPQLMKLVSNARLLWLGKDSMQSLINQTVTFHKLTTLCLDPTLADGWASLPNLLAGSPCLEILEFVHGLRSDVDSVFADMESYLPEQVPLCMSTRLKQVSFGRFYGEEVEFKVVEYFLNNAEVLETMSISPTLIWDSDAEDCVYPKAKDQFIVTKRLLGLPRWSRTCQIVFEYTYN